MYVGTFKEIFYNLKIHKIKRRAKGQRLSKDLINNNCAYRICRGTIEPVENIIYSEIEDINQNRILRLEDIYKNVLIIQKTCEDTMIDLKKQILNYLKVFTELEDSIIRCYFKKVDNNNEMTIEFYFRKSIKSPIVEYAEFFSEKLI
ncbi:TPA: hypothetical protein ACSQRE_000126 [Clostridium perfringens]